MWFEMANSWWNHCPSKDNLLPWGAVYRGICRLLAWPTSVYLFVSPPCTMTYRFSWLRWPALCRHQLLQHAVTGHAASAAQLPPAAVCKPRTVRVNAYTPSLGMLGLEPEYQMSVVQGTASDRAVEPRPIFSLRLSLVGLSLKNRVLY